VARSASAAGRHLTPLAVATGLALLAFAVELVAAMASGSLALIADAGHVFADFSGLALSLTAVWMAARPRSRTRTFGLYRLEILAAVANGIVLLLLSGGILYEALRRLAEPPTVQPLLMLAAAGFGLALNLVALRVLAAGRTQSLTVRAAYLEVIGDTAGSIAVLGAAGVILWTGWHQADAVASIAVAVLIVPRAVSLLRESLEVLLEATPPGVDLAEVEEHIREAPGVEGVHDLHAWTITSGMRVVSAHVVMGPDASTGDILDHLGRCLSDDFDIRHSTFQLETPEHVAWEARSAQPQH
jgi:cation diffusion facilitator family transporter